MNNKFKSTFILICTLLVLTASTSTKSEYYSEVAKSQKLIMDVYKYTVNNYADELDLEEYTRSSIKNIVESLDPYTVYMEEEERSNIDMLTKGKYGGVGIQISKRQGELTVIAPIDDTPAQKAGIQSGDVIAKIDTFLTNNLSSTDAAKLIRGKKGSTVVLHIKRIGYDNLLDFPLIRDDIKVNDVAWFGKVNDDIGYVRLTRFSKNSSGEIKEALISLVNENTDGIILDLRDNPGGLLQSSIEILDMLIPKGELLLSTKGRIKKSNRDYFSQKDPIIPEDIKIAILINNGSASASEIVSGTLQDLDRGIVIGRQSFGKGLVQSVYGLDKKRSLKLTTAKYFIPSGRLIQKEGYLDKKIVSDLTEIDSLYYTSGGRLVKGGGGISPDLKIKNFEYGPLTTACWRKGMYFSFVQQQKKRYKTLEDVNTNFELLNDFAQFIESKELKIELTGEKLFADAKDKILTIDSTDVELISAFDKINQFLKKKKSQLIYEESEEIIHQLKLEFANHFNGKRGRYMESFKQDIDVIEAVEYLSDEKAYEYIFSVNKILDKEY
ncbi:MAG: hypothetical protein CMG69_00980 [Candidatus Marinimicrobia bacterium]|mgnify:CR=1 FL=1|nr:hypothetical protein [Candidatus Neomarinimicrobiota bacterium]|tara:strand:- start:9969 stop:11627 length:1659 start_codon:yes stop_codon:yes gene_type:complete